MMATKREDKTALKEGDDTARAAGGHGFEEDGGGWRRRRERHALCTGHQGSQVQGNHTEVLHALRDQTRNNAQR